MVIQVRVHSIAICDVMPNKKNKDDFLKIWNDFNEKEKLKFIGGFIDGDGVCAFSDGIDSIQLYSKSVPFILEPFLQLLYHCGYVSLKGYKMYISPKVGRHLKPFIIKRNIVQPYKGSVPLKMALDKLQQGSSIRAIAKELGYDKKTITLSLKRYYTKEVIQPFIDSHNTKLK